MKALIKTHGEWMLILGIVLPFLTYVMCVVGPEADRVAQVASK